MHTIQQAVEPTIPLAQVLHRWNQIAADLSEGMRERATQVNILQCLS